MIKEQRRRDKEKGLRTEMHKTVRSSRLEGKDVRDRNKGMLEEELGKLMID